MMVIPADILDKLHRRAIFAAEVPTADAEMRAYVVVIPRVVVPEPTTHNLSPVVGYEVRYLRHDAKCTEGDWGYESDRVLVVETTRVRRVFVARQPDEEPLIAVLSEWLSDLSALQRPHEFDSSLVNSSLELDYHLDRPEDYPHLWLE